MRAIFHIQVELNVARLCNKVYTSVFVLITARTQTAHRPSAHAVGTTAEVAFLEWQHLRVAVRISQPQSYVEHQLVVGALHQLLRVVKVALHVLRVGYVKQLILPQLVLVAAKQLRECAKQVACGLCAGPERHVPVVVGITKACAHNEDILVVISQNHVLVRFVIQILLSERLADPWHKHVVQVQQVKSVVIVAVLLSPLVAPSCCQHSAVELGAVLRVVYQAHIARGQRTTAEVATQEWHDESRETQSCLDAILRKVLIAVALQPLDGLVGATQLQAERLRASEQVAVLVGQRCCRSEVARRVGTLGLETQRARLVGQYLYLSVEQRGVGVLFKGDVGVSHGPQSAKVVVGVLQVGSAVQMACLYKRVLIQHLLSQMHLPVIVYALAVHLTDGVGLVLLGQMQLQVHALLLVVLTGHIGDVLFVESVVAAVLQPLCYLVALLLQRLHAELHARVQQTQSLAQHTRHGGVFYLKLQLAQIVGLAWVQHVHRVDLLRRFLVQIQLYLRIQISLVLQRLLQVAAGHLRL